ncbi:metal ABC transporter permease [Alicyclobacillus fastidiosus]|uniref:Metal ABC transporter permease n=1 Tax=Alicyclobacillus fastidiosus TaxID=392011 RepID=A0ABV5AJT7_9BACL|nr:metal ABC transporter permease [Alicyclobacillus fastidiosus]WEH08359.1 metal ABC transporter permease [Alicyclobacillus fastidiosus]
MGTVWNTILSPGMFSESFMINTWIGATTVAVIAGVVGFFVVLRGSAFVAHALPKGGFAGAAGAALLGANTVIGLAVFSVAGALSIGWLGKRGRHDVVTALILTFLLGAGALFLNLHDVYAPEIYSLLFGEVLGVSGIEIVDTVVLGIVCIAALAILYRPLMLASVMSESAEARGIRVRRIEMYFLVIVGLATAITVPIVGALLTFSLMIAPAAAARYLTHHPIRAVGVSVAIAVITVWISIFLSYDTGWPVGFFVATIAAIVYSLARVWRYLINRGKLLTRRSPILDRA